MDPTCLTDVLNGIKNGHEGTVAALLAHHEEVLFRLIRQELNKGNPLRPFVRESDILQSVFVRLLRLGGSGQAPPPDSPSPRVIHSGSAFLRQLVANLVRDKGRMHAARGAVPIDGEVVVSLDITNTGERSGSEVVQVYVRDNVATQVRPLQELKAFQRVTLSPGETATLTFTLPVEMFNFTRRDGKRIVEPGEFELQIGASSADIREVVTVNVTGETRVLSTEWRMLSTCDVSRA